MQANKTSRSSSTEAARETELGGRERRFLSKIKYKIFPDYIWLQATVVELKRWERRGKAGRKEERERERERWVGKREKTEREWVGVREMEMWRGENIRKEQWEWEMVRLHKRGDDANYGKTEDLKDTFLRRKFNLHTCDNMFISYTHTLCPDISLVDTLFFTAYGLLRPEFVFHAVHLRVWRGAARLSQSNSRRLFL